MKQLNNMCGGNMTHKIISFALLVIALGIFGCSSERYAQNNRSHSMRRDTLRMMTRQDVINLSKAGVSDSLIISMMDATDTWFELKPQEVIDLKNAGVSENVISAMMEQPSKQSGQSSGQTATGYYVYPPYYWYYGYYPYWYSYPRFSVSLGFHGSHGFRHSGRFR
jgi:hypothetical protein